MDKKWVYEFTELDLAGKYVSGDWEKVRGLLGGKGANLAEMTRIGVPVPYGFIITTEACNDYLQSEYTMQEEIWKQIMVALHTIENKSGKIFGDSKNPLLVSCRSGAKFSMPGMMDTVLNIGLNDGIVENLIKSTGNPDFIYDSYRRLVQMFGSVVLNVQDTVFEEIIKKTCDTAGVKTDSQLTATEWKIVTAEFKDIIKRHTGINFPENPIHQLRLAIEAVFKSWNGKRAIDYRNAVGIPHDLGTAVNIVSMVFGNIGNNCATGVAMTRNGSTGEKKLEGDYLINAQGEDVVAGIRMTKDLLHLKDEMPGIYSELGNTLHLLEKHYRDMQDVEFTIENGKLWLLQTRDAKRTAPAAVRIAVDMAKEGIITKEEAVLRVTPDQIDFFMHPQISNEVREKAHSDGKLIATGLNVSPGAASGIVVLKADLAETWAKKDGKQVIMVRPETKPDDVHGMIASQGIVTSRGGRTSHAALVARQFGKPAIVGVSALKIDMERREIKVNGNVIHEGEWISIDGTVGEIYLGKLKTTIQDIKNKWLFTLLSWADEFRHLGVWANADYPSDAERAKSYGAEGIGLCRTEHMFFEPKRLPYLDKMIMTDLPIERKEALNALLPFQKEDFAGIFRVMDGLPVITRLIDPPLHEFLPNHLELIRDITALKFRIKQAQTIEEIDNLIEHINEKERIRKRLESLLESNPMLGLRGVRLGILIPELTAMQVRAIFEAACMVTKEGVEVHPKVMIPLTCHVNELKKQRKLIENEAKNVMKEQNVNIDYKFGTMIEIPRAALTMDQIAEHVSFISFGTNDLTQTTFGISRDDAESGFLINYITAGILPENPFKTIDRDGVGKLMEIAVQEGRSANHKLECGICGEHGGDPESISFCHKIGLTYVSCSPFRVPVARLAAAHAALKDSK